MIFRNCQIIVFRLSTKLLHNKIESKRGIPWRLNHVRIQLMKNITLVPNKSFDIKVQKGNSLGRSPLALMWYRGNKLPPSPTLVLGLWLEDYVTVNNIKMSLNITPLWLCIFHIIKKCALDTVHHHVSEVSSSTALVS